jgi:hypothetical protein
VLDEAPNAVHSKPYNRSRVSQCTICAIASDQRNPKASHRPSSSHARNARKPARTHPAHQPLSQATTSRLTALPTLPLPIHPAPLILGNILIPILPRQTRRSRAPHARFAIENQLLVHRRLAEAKAVLELGFVQEHGVGLGFDWDVDRAGDEPCFVLGGLADVWCSVLVSE